MSETVETKEATFDLVVKDFNLGTLTTNAEAIREAVKAKLEGYKVENYSGDKIQDAKRDKAELNAAAKKLNDARLEYERTWMKPFKVFKDVVDETVALIKEASSKIDQVVKDVEQGEKDEKRRLIEQFWEKQACTLFKLEQIFDDRWLNKTSKLLAVQDEIRERIKKVESDLGILDKIGESKAKAFYLTCLDLNKAMAEADRIKENRERLAKVEQDRAEAEDRRRKADEERKAKEEAGRLEAARKTAAAVIAEEGLSVAGEQPEEPAEEPEAAGVESTTEAPAALHEVTLKFFGTIDQLKALREYIDEQGIKYEKIA